MLTVYVGVLCTVNDCLNQYTTEEQFEAYKQKRAKDLTQKST